MLNSTLKAFTKLLFEELGKNVQLREELLDQFRTKGTLPFQPKNQAIKYNSEHLQAQMHDSS